MWRPAAAALAYTHGGASLLHSLVVSAGPPTSTSSDRQLQQYAWLLCRSGVEWQKHLKRGLHTLHKPEYQLLYVVDGLVPAAEAPSLKVIKAAATYNTS
jgi:hypothetical protein